MEQVTDQNYSGILTSDKPVMVDFWAPWCQPCRMLGPTIEEIAQEYEGRAVVGKCNVDENEELAGKLGIRSIPSVFFFKGGKPVDVSVGLVPKEALTEKLNKLL